MGSSNMARIYYQLQRSTPGNKRFRDWRDPWSHASSAAHYAVQALKTAVPGAVIRIVPFEGWKP